MIFRRNIDIHSKKWGIAGRLSNFTEREFTFDGILCRSVEGVLQSLKFETEAERRIVCGLWGKQAKKAGEMQNWAEKGMLHWKNDSFHRTDKKYDDFLKRLYKVVYAQDAEFRKDIAKVEKCSLTHRIGKSNPAETVLTEQEFISCLRWLCETK